MKMRWKLALSFIFFAVEMIFYVTTENSKSEDKLSCRNPKGYIFEFLSVTSFIDENRYIRLNISWENPKANFTNFEMMIDTNCTALYGDRNISVNNKNDIVPNMDRLKHPADPLQHGCKYDFELYTEATFGNQSCIISQVVDYEIPACVGTVCQCEIASSPYEYQEIKSIGDDLYEIKFYKTDSNVDLNLETVFHRILYANMNTNKTVTTVHPADISFENDLNTFTLPLQNLHSGNSYIIYIDLVLDNCEYHFTSNLEVPQEPISEFAQHYASYFVFLIVLCILISLYAYWRTKPQLIEKLRRYVPFLPSLPDLPIRSQEVPMVKIACGNKDDKRGQQHAGGLREAFPIFSWESLTKPNDYGAENKMCNEPKSETNRVTSSTNVCDKEGKLTIRIVSGKEVINSQYTPLEFIVNAHKFDKYEFPRNKIILKDQIGGGAFGHVYRADIYELDNKPGYTVAAAKKPIENAPAEEVADFLAEIETMKKIANFGGHPNVIQIFACVTIESPHIMVMELVPCGSLKTYLSNLRKEWEQRKRRLKLERNNQHFFPDNMIVENFIQPVASIPEREEAEKLKYTDLAFDDYTNYSISSGTNSYVTPDTPSTPGSPFGDSAVPKLLSKSPKIVKARQPKRLVPACLAPLSPVTPDSVTSSGLPSVAYTLLTPLESEAETPLIDLTEEAKLKPVLDSKELQNFALQIGNGMAFLESIEITHRDLAARNILISADKVLKISDFGMARVGVYVNTTQKRQPLRWMAPEAIENRRCDNKTDVWSFGVVLWEIGSLGAFPYKDLSNELVIAHILQGKMLERPETCTDQLYELMQRCWQKNPDDRPRFEEIAKQLDINNGKIYVDFSKISPKYVFPPTQDGTK